MASGDLALGHQPKAAWAREDFGLGHDGSKQAMLATKLTKQRDFVDLGQIGHLARGGSSHALTGKKLKGGVYKALSGRFTLGCHGKKKATLAFYPIGLLWLICKQHLHKAPVTPLGVEKESGKGF